MKYVSQSWSHMRLQSEIFKMAMLFAQYHRAVLVQQSTEWSNSPSIAATTIYFGINFQDRILRWPKTCRSWRIIQISYSRSTLQRRTRFRNQWKRYGREDNNQRRSMTTRNPSWKWQVETASISEEAFGNTWFTAMGQSIDTTIPHQRNSNSRCEHFMNLWNGNVDTRCLTVSIWWLVIGWNMWRYAHIILCSVLFWYPPSFHGQWLRCRHRLIYCLYIVYGMC